MARRPTAIRIDPDDYEQIELKKQSGEIEDVSTYVREAIKERLDENRVSVVLDPTDVRTIRYLVEIGAYDSEESFLREAARRLLYIAKDREMVREALFDVLLDDPAVKTAIQTYIHEVFVEGFRPPPGQQPRS
ncbi:MAG: hypothetical protein PHH09_03945 [Methanoregulaceae archaeon]|nr:hypothetical protein [Methanoregulaceae archaeon]